MKWNDVRDTFPDRWVVAESLRTRREGGREVQDLTVLATFPESAGAIQRQREIFRTEPGREVVIAFTGWLELEIDEISWAGMRTRRRQHRRRRWEARASLYRIASMGVSRNARMVGGGARTPRRQDAG